MKPCSQSEGNQGPATSAAPAGSTVWTTLLTVCVLLSAVPGRTEQLADYEDQALALLAAHNGSVVVRMQAAEGPYAEIHVIEFVSEADFERFQADPRRLSLTELREASVAAATVIKGQRIAGST